jgi:DNA uptake protein ComE-like DNA-binding protein
VGSFAWALAPLVTLGFAAPPCFIYAAVKLRSRLLGLASAGYAALAALSIWGAGTNSDTNWQANIGLVATFALVAASTGHTFAIRRSLFFGGQTEKSAIDRAQERLRLRDDSRKIAETNPRLAHELQIGRPDLQPTHDDGGLIDVNHVPVESLSEIASIGPELATQIVDVRRHVGAFQSRDDLEVTVGIEPHLLDGVADVLIFCR